MALRLRAAARERIVTDDCTCGLADEKDQVISLDGLFDVVTGASLDGQTTIIPARTHHFWSCPLSDPLGDIRRFAGLD